jgi:hypothetical protein
MTAEQTWREVSVGLEDATGYDSIPTIERIYEDNGRYLCPFPGCVRATRSAETMWRHVHFSRAHGLSFDARTPEAAARKHGLGDVPVGAP